MTTTEIRQKFNYRLGASPVCCLQCVSCKNRQCQMLGCAVMPLAVCDVFMMTRRAR